MESINVAGPPSGGLETLRALRWLVDPQKVLPNVSIERSDLESDNALVEDLYILAPGVGLIGEIQIGAPGQGLPDHVESVSLDPEYRDMGYGTAAYLAAIARSVDCGRDLRSDPRGTTDVARRVWQGLGRVLPIDGLDGPCRPDVFFAQVNYVVRSQAVREMLAGQAVLHTQARVDI
ncbi:MAG TPA: hypothetical protein VF261_00115 [Candidatus Saccharimonadales bacterium]